MSKRFLSGAVVAVFLGASASASPVQMDRVTLNFPSLADVKIEARPYFDVDALAAEANADRAVDADVIDITAAMPGGPGLVVVETDFPILEDITASDDFPSEDMTVTPVPAAAPLFLTSLAGIALWRRRRARAS